MKDEEQPSPSEKKESKKVDMKKKKANMLAKMKKKQSKYISSNTTETMKQEQDVDQTAEQEEVINCAFC